LAPEVSVVIPTYRRDARLAFTVDALASQTLSRDRYEILVVRDDDNEALGELPGDLQIRFITLPAPGPAMRRNRGWQEARGELIVFTDDDCRPSPGWLESMLEAYRNGPGEDVVLEGRTEPDPDEAHLYHGLARSMEVYGPNRWYPTCNLAMPRSLIERLGGFNEELAFWGEDTDLGLRAEGVGARLVYVDEAVVWHCVHVRSLRAALKDATVRHAEAEVLARHPDQRDELYMGWFIGEEHARVTLALAGLLLARRSPALAALAAYPYVIHKIAKRPLQPGFLSPTGLARLAVDVAGGALVDGTEVAMRLRTSLRKRTLVL
jgi:glycosyltransferase involved in cell wall biosynthesis